MKVSGVDLTDIPSCVESHILVAVRVVQSSDGGLRLATAGITASVWAGKARLAFHRYNTEEDVDLAPRA